MSIVFLKDWKKYPSAIIHYETSNKSFLRLAEIYYNMGIKNCAFHLSLLNPALKNVDPFDPDIDEETILMILDEVCSNYWYYIREVMRVESSGNIDGVPFKANRSNIAVYWLYHAHITTLCTVIRQTGKTTMLKALYTWLLEYGISGAIFGLVTKDSSLKQETMESIKEQLEYLPDYLKLHTKRDVMNSDEIDIKATKNKLKCWLSNTSKKLAAKVARGFPIGTMGWDEAAYIENIETAMGSATFSGNEARPTLASKGLPYGTLLFTTAGDKESRDGGYIYRMITNGTMFSEAFFDCEDEKELEELIFKNSSARNNNEALPIVVVSFSYRQMGYSEKWMQERLRDNKQSSRTDLNRDLFNRWVSASSLSPLTEEDIENLDNSAVTEPRCEFYPPFNYLLNWFVSEEELLRKTDNKHSLVIGVDTSDGAGRDDIGFYVRDSATGETLVTAVFNEINLITLSSFFVDFLIKYPNSVMIIERKSSAPAIIDNMISLLCNAGINPFRRLYNTIVQNKEQYPKEYEEILRAKPYNEDIFIKHKRHIGFVTSGKGITSRDQLFSTVMSNKLKYTAHLVRDKVTIHQFLGLIIKNNRIDHPEGGHDDMVISALLTYWLLMFGKNLSFYGMETNLILKKNDVYLNDKFNIDNDKYEQQEMESLEQEINDLIEQIKNELNPVIIAQLERRIRFLYKDIKKDNYSITVEDLLESLRKDHMERFKN